MKQKTNRTMLLLLCAAIAAIYGLMTYFACSADDDWEGTPEYLHTHAPMLTRAGMDVSGDDEPVYRMKLKQCPADSLSTQTYVVDNIQGFTSYVKFYWTIGYADEIIPSNNIHVNKPADSNTIRYVIQDKYLSNIQHFTYGSIGTPGASLHNSMVIKYKKEYYHNNIFDRDTTIEAIIPFQVDASEYAYWVRIINGVEYTL